MAKGVKKVPAETQKHLRQVQIALELPQPPPKVKKVPRRCVGDDEICFDVRPVFLATSAGAVSIAINALASPSSEAKDNYSVGDLYGMGSEQFDGWLSSGTNNREIWMTLNVYAGVLARREGKPENFKTDFDNFMVELEKNWPNPPKVDPWSPVGVAYCALRYRSVAPKGKQPAELTARI
ncbi:MAG: hypothetical protein Q9182_002325 [Xanthomendoza sp. 2 TL-2023]